jgi:Glycosyl hydrolase-like 10
MTGLFFDPCRIGRGPESAFIGVQYGPGTLRSQADGPTLDSTPVPAIKMLKAQRCRLVLMAIGLVLLATRPGWAGETWLLTRQAASFDRSALTRTDSAAKILAGGSLSGAKGDWGITGWVEYDFAVPGTGWYEITVRGGGNEVQYSIDPQSPSMRSAPAVYGTSGHSLEADKVGNFWLTSGRHTLRLQRYFWTGFPRIESFTVTASALPLAKTMRASLADPVGIYRLRQCAPLEFFHGGRSVPTLLNVWFKDANDRLRHTELLPIPRSTDLQRQTLALPCDEPGVFTVSFGENGAYIPYPDVRSLRYEVIDTEVRPQARGNKSDLHAARTLVEEIDCVRQPSDYFGGGQTRIASTVSGFAYRESGPTGFTRYQRAPSDSIRKLLPEPSWFAYRLHNVVAQRPYLVEVDHPDDRLRTFAIALRESAPLSYPVAGGVDSGGEFPVSGKLHTESLIYWPRAPSTRVTFLNTHDDRRAACAKIRVYRLDEPLAPLIPQGTAGRHFLNWYEEGSNFLSMYGARDGDFTEAATRWANAVRHAGGTVLAPTVVVYEFALYPSQFNRAFSQPDNDKLRRLILIAEQHGLKVLPELHPRADELAWPFNAAPDPKPHLLVSKDGQVSGGIPPLHNPLHPVNQDWYLGMIGELADRYRDSPALLGVNLRLMQWKNPALNNFHSLDWGYDDFSVDLFRKETGSAVPMGNASDPSRFAERHLWLMANARAQWIDWRCRKIAALYTRIRDRVRQARPDLKVYSSVFRWEGHQAARDALREAGIDPALLGAIDRVELIDARHSYGRNEADMLDTQAIRDPLIDPRELTLLSAAGASANFLAGAAYLEITEAVAHPRALGFPENTKLTWTSGAANPAGRHALERFAVALAETDAKLLGDGGNGYSLGRPLVREFLAEYLRLPAEPFKPRADARDPVAVWESNTTEAFYFYAVNRERYPVVLDMEFPAGTTLTRIAGNEPVALPNNLLHLELQPYQLLAYRARRDTRIMKIDVRVPFAQQALVTAQVRWLEQLARTQQEKWLGKLDKVEQQTLENTVKESVAALARSHFWRARTALELRPMLSIYRNLGQMPPHLRAGDENP